ncbi:potassium channel family protein [Pseudomonas sp. N040]|uniref:potassium channel family protein n=1 Tax=Pseudomonas sp. N040 TaxID=2785325 RepID=UPI0018A31B5E|nr:potassium channel family protein [Pseudomonas sp. N040]MBF7728729.1 NAD-binding protein [Pseudomonas sp. N040]MBW7012369.1 potassium channel family protein [Pseudomonas sp. N040]
MQKLQKRKQVFHIPGRITQLPRIRKRIMAAIALLLMMHLIGAAGFYALSDRPVSFSDALHMTMITITTVGYGEVIPLNTLGERLFAGIFAIAGFGTITFLFTSLATFFLESDLDYSLRRRRMEKAIKKLSNHYIVCGFGRVGCNVAHELVLTRRRFVVIDLDEHRLLEQLEHFPDLLYLHGDASDDELLLTGDIADAAGVFAVTGDDSLNLMIVITARQLNPEVRIVARCHEIRNAQKMRKAGADVVISPDFSGGMRIAASMIRPHVVNFLDEMLRSEQKIRLEELVLEQHHRLCSVGELRERCPGCVMVALKSGEDFVFNPSDHLMLTPGQVLITMVPPDGRSELLDALN